jgi:hypothetical protein
MQIAGIDCGMSILDLSACPPHRPRLTDLPISSRRRLPKRDAITST